ncbi:radical SAM protein [Geotalea uraniireducens]|uniref:Radical SAM protein n=1 Tax=Geotalea uraniireducens TaxID=351604 RepID=A0ABM8ELH0_9BACT|nr:radical SAM protein [Geotalea uraniireducens]BDV42865.1 radical SAM protein [Geotalea uraniireducens]
MNYLDLYTSGELLARVKAAYARLRSCDLCPHRCGVDRLAGAVGSCGAGAQARVASVSVHHGEEPPISGSRGSGTIFFSHCTLHCRFCQNFPISQLGNGNDLTPRQLAEKMLGLQRKRVHNVNLVTPTHMLPQILAALYLAVPRGFTLPLVWNSSGYETVDALHLLDGVVDIYLPDMKYVAEEPAVGFSAAPGYRAANRAAVVEMLRQVGHFTADDNGIGVRGLIIRHLVLPEGAAGSGETFRWIAALLGKETHVALMNQYFPAHRAPETPGLQRKITADEYAAAVAALEAAGLENGWVQE